jgi:hypothetical protein
VVNAASHFTYREENEMSMSEFKIAYENQTGQYRRKRFELSIPVIIPQEAMKFVNEFKSIITDDEKPELEDKKTKKSKKKDKSNEETIQLSSIGMIAAATVLAALAKD